MHVVVAGGGFAGMVAARRLAADGAVVELLEARDHVGGRARSREVDGYTLDHGFQLLFTAYPALEYEVDLDAIELRRFAPGVTLARPNHRSTLADPIRNPSAAVGTLLNRDIPTRDKFRLFQFQRELWRRDADAIFDEDRVDDGHEDGDGERDDGDRDGESGSDEDADGSGTETGSGADDAATEPADDGAEPGDEDETGPEAGDAETEPGDVDTGTSSGTDDTESGREEPTMRQYLAEWDFSEAFVERFAEPFFGGITLDRSLSSSSRVLEYTFKMLVEGNAVVPAEGMSAISTHLRERARVTGATIRTAKPVTHIEVDGDSVRVEAENEEIFPGAVVVATDPETASDLTEVDTPTEGRGCVTVHCSIPAQQSLDTGRRVILNSADARPNVVAPMSAVAPEYAPDDRRLLSATFLGEQDADDEALGEEVRHALDAWYPENQFDDFELVAVDRIPFAQIHQPPGFRKSLPAVDDPEGPVYLAGDYTEWSSFQGALDSGRRAAEAVLRDHG